MDSRELEIFLVVAEQLHFGRASQLCHLSPSALTRTVQRLEQQVGQSLFVRNKREVHLTAAGEKFRLYASESLLKWSLFKQELSQDQTISGSLSIYASITAVYSLLPDLLEDYRQTYPAVQLELRTGAAEQAVIQVQRGEIDLAVAAWPDYQQPRIEFLPITPTPLVFIAPVRSTFTLPMDDEGSLDMARVPLVVPQEGLSRRRLNRWLKEHHVTPNISSEISGNEAIIAMVRLGGGVGIVPELVLERSPFRDDVVVIDKAPQLEPYVVGLCCTQLNLQRPSVAAFWQLAEQHGATPNGGDSST